jgi:hypothetical protein
MEDDRLRQLTPDLAGLLAQHGAAPTQLAACRLAVAAADLDDDRAAVALEALSAGPDRTSGELMDALASMGTGVVLDPVMATGLSIGGFETDETAAYVEAWEIRFTTYEGSFSYRGPTVADAVAEAWANATNWR